MAGLRGQAAEARVEAAGLKDAPADSRRRSADALQRRDDAVAELPGEPAAAMPTAAGP